MFRPVLAIFRGAIILEVTKTCNSTGYRYLPWTCFDQSWKCKGFCTFRYVQIVSLGMAETCRDKYLYCFSVFCIAYCVSCIVIVHYAIFTLSLDSLQTDLQSAAYGRVCYWIVTCNFPEHILTFLRVLCVHFRSACYVYESATLPCIMYECLNTPSPVMQRQ